MLLPLLFLSAAAHAGAEEDRAKGRFDAATNCLYGLQKFASVFPRDVGPKGAHFSLHRSGMQYILPATREVNGKKQDGIYIYTLNREQVTFGEGRAASFLPFPPDDAPKGLLVEKAGGGLFSKPKPTGNVEYFLSSSNVITGRSENPAHARIAAGLEEELHVYLKGKRDGQGKFQLETIDSYTYPKFTLYRKEALLGGSKRAPDGTTDDEYERKHFAKSANEENGLVDPAATKALLEQVTAETAILKEHFELFGGKVTKEKIPNFQAAYDRAKNFEAECVLSQAQTKLGPQPVGTCMKLGMMDPYPADRYLSVVSECKKLTTDESYPKETRLAIAKNLAAVQNVAEASLGRKPEPDALPTGTGTGISQDAR